MPPSYHFTYIPEVMRIRESSKTVRELEKREVANYRT